MSAETPFEGKIYKTNLHREWRAAAPGWQRWLDVLEAEGHAPAGPAATRGRPTGPR